MSTPEQELEAATWEAMTLCRATVPDALRFIELLTFAAQRYAAGDSEIVAELRRKVLERDTAEQTSASTSGGDGGAAPELHPPGSTAAGRMSTAVGGATLSTGPDVPAAGKDRAKFHPQGCGQSVPWSAEVR